MGQYPEVVQQLHSAAVDQGLSTYTLVYGLAQDLRKDTKYTVGVTQVAWEQRDV
jgi:hypothetical protein